MPAPTKKTFATVGASVIIALIPGVLGYCENRDEIKAKYARSQGRASNGYAALAKSVEELQGVVKTQHEYLVKLEERVEGLKGFVGLALYGKPLTVTNAGSGAVSPVTAPTASTDLLKVMTGAHAPAPKEPDFKQLPANYTAAQQQLD